ncbi:MAG: glycosyltransferase family 39 protein, partial [Candidatus Kapabacteria bacterium]|nr:glycosyltransferase family 39 protein [Candidatus Kapabacteria bacterium]
MLSNRQHTAIAFILSLVCLYAIRLTSFEVQPWDEGLYAVRAQSIVVYGNWTDQTEHSLGGLYSSTPPPMLPWAIAGTMSVFGQTVASIRLFNLFSAGISFLLLYLIALRMLSFRSSLLAVCVLAGCMHWMIYSRQAMTEVPLMMFVLLAVWSALKIIESTSTRDAWLYALLGGFAFGAALHTKMIVSFLPLFIFIVVAIRTKKFTLHFVLASVIGLVLALPWYAMMVMNHGELFWHALTIPQITSEVEGNAPWLGVMYYVNQMFVSHPLLLVALVWTAYSVWKRQFIVVQSPLAYVVALLWFVIGIVIFSLAPTKNSHYIVMLLPAAVLVAVYGIERLVAEAPRRLVIATYCGIAILGLWSVMPGLRESLRSFQLNASTLPFVIVFILLCVLPFVLPKRMISTLSVSLFKPLVNSVVAIMILRAVWLIVVEPPPMITGGKEIASILNESTARTFGYVFHEQNAGDKFNPQLAWYTDGWMAGRIGGRSVSPFAMRRDSVDDVHLSKAATSGLPFIVYYHAGMSSQIQERVGSVLQ